MRKMTLVLLPLALAGCQTWGPTWSEVSGARYHRAELNRSPTVIENVDGWTPMQSGPYRTARIEPGTRMIVLQGVPLRPGWQGTLKAYTLDAQPCRRYYLNAQFDGPLSPSDWMPVIDYVEPIAGCSTTVAAK